MDNKIFYYVDQRYTVEKNVSKKESSYITYDIKTLEDKDCRNIGKKIDSIISKQNGQVVNDGTIVDICKK